MDTALTLQVTGLSVRFGGLVALSDVTYGVPAGAFVGLIGPNGAGKSTLLNAVSGFVPPSAGTVAVGGQDVTAWPPQRRAAAGLGRTFQHPVLIEELPVLANVVMAQHRDGRGTVLRGLFGLDRDAELAARRRAAEVLELMSLRELAGTKVGALSYATRRLVQIACVAARSPGLVLLDEPSAGLDASETADLADMLRALHERLGFTGVLVDHDLMLVERVAETVTVLEFGQVIAHGSYDDVRRDPRVISSYLGSAAGKAVSRASS